jgi:hypothetical protein
LRRRFLALHQQVRNALAHEEVRSLRFGTLGSGAVWITIRDDLNGDNYAVPYLHVPLKEEGIILGYQRLRERCPGVPR